MALLALPGLPQSFELSFNYIIYLCPSSPLLSFFVLLAVFHRYGGLSAVPKSSAGSSTAPLRAKKCLQLSKLHRWIRS